MKHHIVAVLLVSIAIHGCKRKAPEEAAKDPNPSASQAKSESGAEMVLIPGERFLMGDENEIDATPHEVVLSPFYIDKNLVTQAEYQRVMGENPSRWKGGDNPVEQVRW